jgi:hypothetical protein
MRGFLIRLVQVFALAIIGTGFLVDTSFAEQSRQVAKSLCDTAGGTFVVEHDGKYSCIYQQGAGTGSVVKNCTRDGECTVSTCRRGTCITTPYGDDGKKKPPKPTQRDGTTIMTAGTAADRGLRAPGATTSGAPVNSALNAGAPSHTSPAVSTGAALNSQAAIGLAGIDKPAAIPSQLSDRLNRMRR